MDTVDDVLAHFGVRGMKWGVRKARSSKKLPASEDAAAAKSAKKIVKKHGTQALSNKELQALVTRMNLEQQYSNLTSKSSSSAFDKIEIGQKKVRTLIGVGKSVNDLAQFAQSPTGKAIASEIKKHAAKHTN